MNSAVVNVNSCVCWTVEDIVKLYSYSSELLTFVEVKWVIVKYAISGILIGTVISIGVIKLNQSDGNTLGSRSANTLAADNNFLRQQVGLISLRVSRMEMQARQLNEHANKLHMLLPYRKIVGDTVSSFTNATNGLKSQSLISAARSLRPKFQPRAVCDLNSKIYE
jgi:hypothetical protein